jgi:glyoxylase-like metal-dependent hydrolase (beta-lactamase superfamily II)
VFARLPKARVELAQRIQASMAGWSNIRPFAENSEVLPGIQAIATYGHSPGHTSYLLHAGSAKVMVLGDVTNIPSLNLRNPGWHLAADQDPVMAEETRRRMLDRVSADRVVCTGYHWGMPGAGTVVVERGGYTLVPVV